jgi:hypothetical protein
VLWQTALSLAQHSSVVVLLSRLLASPAVPDGALTDRQAVTLHTGKHSSSTNSGRSSSSSATVTAAAVPEAVQRQVYSGHCNYVHALPATRVQCLKVHIAVCAHSCSKLVSAAIANPVLCKRNCHCEDTSQANKAAVTHTCTAYAYCSHTHQLCAIVGESALKQLCARHLRGVDTAALYRPTLAEAACTRAAATAESTAAATAALSSVEVSKLTLYKSLILHVSTGAMPQAGRVFVCVQVTQL